MCYTVLLFICNAESRQNAAAAVREKETDMDENRELHNQADPAQDVVFFSPEMLRLVEESSAGCASSCPTAERPPKTVTDRPRCKWA